MKQAIAAKNVQAINRRRLITATTVSAFFALIFALGAYGASVQSENAIGLDGLGADIRRGVLQIFMVQAGVYAGLFAVAVYRRASFRVALRWFLIVNGVLALVFLAFEEPWYDSEPINILYGLEFIGLAAPLPILAIAATWLAVMAVGQVLRPNADPLFKALLNRNR